MSADLAYSLSDYGHMIADGVRTAAYAAALERAVTLGCTVLDVGAGAGFFALLACRLGARHVYAIEPNDAIQTGRELAAANGFTDRITFVQGLSTRLALPEPADVVISDLRGVLPLLGRHIPTLADVRARLLKPGGTLIPWRDTIHAAVVDAPAVAAGAWQMHALGVDLSPARRRELNTWRKARIEPGHLLTAPQRWATIDYTTADSADVSRALTWTFDRAGRAHGVALWFDADLAPGIGFSNAPGAPRAIYGQAFFPFAEAVSISEGDAIHVDIAARLIGDEYLWSWATRVLARGDERHVVAGFRQSTLHGLVLSPDTLRKRADRHVPVLDEEGQLDAFILSRMDGRTSVGELARLVQQAFPQRFSRWEQAVSRVGDWSVKYDERAAPIGVDLPDPR